MSGFTLELPSTEQIKNDLQAELALNSEEKTTIDSAVKEKGDAILAVDLDSSDQRLEFAGVAENFGDDVIKLARRRNVIVGSNVSNLIKDGANTGEIAIGIARLTDKMKKLDPTGIDFTRSGVIGKLFNPAKQYFARYDAEDKDIADILDSLNKGRSILVNDNTTLELEEVSMRKLTKLLNQDIELGSQLCQYLTTAISEKKALGVDIDKTQYIEQEIIYPIEQRVMDFQQMLLVNQQGIIALEVVRKNNLELIRAVDRARNVTVTSLKVAVTVAGALYNQKIVLTKVNVLNTATNHMITATSSLLHSQGVEVQKQAMGANISVDALKESFTNTIAALDDISNFRERAIPQMEHVIDQFKEMSDEGERYLKRMDNENS